MKTKTNFIKISILTFILLPGFAYAQFDTLGKIVDNFTSQVVSTVGALLLTLGTVVFIWGVVKFMWGKSQGKTEGVKIGQDFMGWGLLALFVMFSVWGIIAFVQSSLGPNFNKTDIKAPSFILGGA